MVDIIPLNWIPKLLTMLKNLFIFFLFTSFVAANFSCKKESAGTDSYIKFKKNGTWVTLEALGALGPNLGDATKMDLEISSQATTATGDLILSIQKQTSVFNIGTYDSDASTHTISIDYFDYTTSSSFSIEDNSTTHSRYYITITSITPTRIEGTFTGNFLYNFIDDETVNITEGEFKVNRVR